MLPPRIGFPVSQYQKVLLKTPSSTQWSHPKCNHLFFRFFVSLLAIWGPVLKCLYSIMKASLEEASPFPETALTGDPLTCFEGQKFALLNVFLLNFLKTPQFVLPENWKLPHSPPPFSCSSKQRSKVITDSHLMKHEWLQSTMGRGCQLLQTLYLFLCYLQFAFSRGAEATQRNRKGRVTK